MAKAQYRVVQPWGRDRAREATEVSAHATVAAAFAAIDRMAAQMVRTGAPSDSIELIVIDPHYRILQRPES